MSRLLPATALIALLSSCQWAPERAPDLDSRVRELRSRVQRLQARLAEPRASTRQIQAPRVAERQSRPATPLMETGSRPKPELAKSQAEPRLSSIPSRGTSAIEASTPRAPGRILTTTLFIESSADAHLKSGAAWLASLPPENAGAIVLDNWRSAGGQARTLELFFHMNARSAAAIFATLPTQLIRWGPNREHVHAYAPQHPAANAKGYVLVRILRER